MPLATQRRGCGRGLRELPKRTDARTAGFGLADLGLGGRLALVAGGRGRVGSGVRSDVAPRLRRGVLRSVVLLCGDLFTAHIGRHLTD
jgi:hypothetical protein